MTKNVFVTGGSGFLGKNYLEKAFLENNHYYVLARSEKARNEIRGVKNFSPEKVEFVEGNLLYPRLGVDPGTEYDLREDLNEIWHMAASTSFDDRERDLIIQSNKTGTKNVLDFSKKCKNLENFYWVGTFYTAGITQKLVEEDKLPKEKGFIFGKRPTFRNSYEESKWEAEKMVRDSDLPWNIFRPSIMLGDSKTYDSQCERRMMYGYLLGVALAIKREMRGKGIDFKKVFSKETDPLEVPLRLIGYPDVRKNFIPIDEVVDSMVQISKNKKGVHKTYNLNNSSNILVSEIESALEDSLNVRGLKYVGNEIKNPNGLESLTMNYTQPFVPYAINTDPIGIRENTNSNLNSEYVPPKMNYKLFSNLLNSFVKSELALK